MTHKRTSTLRDSLLVSVFAASLLAAMALADTVEDPHLSVKGVQIPRPMAFRVPPHARFVAPDAAVFSWETDKPCESILEYGVGEKWDRRIEDSGSKTTHRIQLRGLEPKARY